MEPLVRKRSGKLVPFSRFRIVNAVYKAMKAVGIGTKEDAEKIADAVSVILYRTYFKKGDIPHVETIQDIIEKTLMEKGYPEVAKAYILYREKRREAREISKALVDGVNLIEEYLGQEDWRVRENSNMNYSLQGLNFHVSSSIVARYWLEKLYPKEVAQAHIEGDFHIHDLGILGPYTYYGKEVVIAKYRGRLLLVSFEKLYEILKEEEYVLDSQDEAFAKRPQELYVLDKDGWVKVLRITRKKKDKPMRFIKNRGGRSVIVTEDHPMITESGIKEARVVKVEEDKLFTVDLKRLLEGEELFKIKQIDLLEEVKKKRNYFKEEIYFNGLPIDEFPPSDEDGIIHTLTFSAPRFIKLDENFGYFLGFVLAEGYLSYDQDNSRCISVVQKDLFVLLELNEKLRTCGFYGCITPKGEFYELRVRNPFLRFLFEEVFKILPGARNKTLPLEILSYDLAFVKGVIGGLLDGDGNIETAETVLSIRISSRALLEGLAVLLSLLGFTPRDRNIEGQGQERVFKGRIIKQKFPIYGISFRKLEELDLPSYKYREAKNSSKAWHDEDRDNWHKVINNEPVEIPDEWIYDITTESGTLVVNGMWNHNCVGWDLYDLLLRGFGGVPGKVESLPPKHFRTALGQIVNFFYTLQGEAAGAQAFSNFDTLLAPFVRYDKLSYEEVKQCMQEFLFNLNVPTRVGFQCLSEDTEILTPSGWKRWNEVEEGDLIYTFNLEKKTIEVKKVTYVFKRHYEGIMYNLKNRTQDQLISPGHRVVRQVFNSEKFVLQPIEELLDFKSLIAVPVTGENSNEDYPISDDELKLIAWILSEGSIEKDGLKRVSIYQSKEKHPENYEEIIHLIKKLNLEYTEREQESWGKCIHIRLSPQSSKYVHAIIGNPKKIFPNFLYQLSKRQAQIFLETYAKGDGWIEGGRIRIVTTDKDFADGLMAVGVLAGYNVSQREREPEGNTKKLRYELTFTQTKTDYIQKIENVPYSGIIWSVHTENETVIARRAGQVFITGNTPFTNLTFDLKPSKLYANVNVIIGGKPREEVYGEFHKEMSMINRAFCELMMAGDAKGRIFTFPIPTYNITKDFDWDNPDYEPLWEMTRKYGIPYFANFVNSDMDPDDARSMCCRLRLDQREVRKRGGGLFGANPLTGSIGVVTINLPRIAYLSTCEEEFFERLERLMELAKTSLEIKRKVIEDFTERGLYPYSKVYLQGVKEARGQYWANHFSTIGIVGMNEACLNFLGEPIYTKAGKEFALKVLKFMREKIAEFQEVTGNLYNLEATPAEGTSYRLARLDKKKFPRIKTQGTPEVPYYTNSVHLPVYYTDDIFEILTHQDDLQVMFTGGTVVHLFVGEEITDRRVVKELVRAIVHRFRLPYFSITPTFSVCPVHGYIPGRHDICPFPHTEEELERFGQEIVVPTSLLNKLSEGAVKILSQE